MNLSESYKKRLQELSGIDNNYGTNKDFIKKTTPVVEQNILDKSPEEIIKEETNINSNYSKDILYGLKQHAKHFDNYKDFENFYSIKGNHGIYYHLTDNPNFSPSQQTGPRDMSSMAAGRISEKGALMVTSDLEYWDSYYNNYDPGTPKDEDAKRNYVAIIDLSEIEPSKLNPTQRGFGHEIYLKPDAAKKAKIIKVLNVKDARKFDDNFNKIKPNSENELKKLWDTVKNTEMLPENKLPKVQSMLSKYKLRYPKDNVLIIVNIDKLLARHKKDEPSYAFDTREASDYPGRVEGAKKYWMDYADDPRPISPKTGERKDWGDMNFYAPYITISDDGRLGFSDGRHRVIAMKELGYKDIIIEVPKFQMHMFDSLK